MMNKINYSISKEYTINPGPRFIKQGSYSGEDFLNSVLLNKFDEAVASRSILIIDLDKTSGYGPSFLEEAFGGLSRLREINKIFEHLDFVSLEEPYLKEEIFGYIKAVIKK